MPSRLNWWYRGAVVALLIALGFYADRRDLMGLHLSYRDTVEKVQGSDATLAQLQEAETALRSKVEYLKNDPLEIEATIRAEKRLLREGETIYRVILRDTEDE